MTSTQVQSDQAATKAKSSKPKKLPAKGTPRDIYWARLMRGMSPERFGDVVLQISGMTIRKLEDGRTTPAQLLPETKRAISVGLGEVDLDGNVDVEKYMERWS